MPQGNKSGRVLVLGAAGRFGFTVATAFRDDGWTVRGLVRPGRSGAVPRGVTPVEAVTRDEAMKAGEDCAIVVNALNPAITKWKQNGLSLAYGAIATAESNGATLMFPGSVWNFGNDIPETIDETTPMHPSSRKGAMRVEIEQRIAEACDRGMRAIIVRAGDYFGAGRGSWLDLVIAKDLDRNRVTYPGPLDVIHAWAYLPDLAEAFVRLAGIRDRFAPCESFGFPGYAITGSELVGMIEQITGGKFNIRQMSWWFLKSFGRFLTIGRELVEIEYLWRMPHRISGDKLKAALGDVPHTPLKKALTASLRELGFRV
jgi:nucleoside-diphosphate-sugar epimerase